MRVPHGALKYTAYVHKALSSVVANLQLHDAVKQNLMNNFRIAHTRRATIANVLVNSRRYARNFDPENEPMCVLDCKSKNHDILLGEDLHGLARHVLTQYARDIPSPNAIDSKFELLLAFREVLPSIDKILVEGMEDQTLVEKFDSRDPTFAQTIELLTRAAEINCPTETRHVCSANDVYQARAMLSEYVVVELDKNSGKLACLCPVRFHRAMMEMYVEDKLCYEPIPGIDPQMILDEWAWVYDKNGWETIAPIERGESSSVPFAHLLPKFKDTSRYRQIVSYAKHPVRSVMSV